MNIRKDFGGALFQNDRKDSERWPDYKGGITINGVEYWLSAWWKEGTQGRPKFLSLSAKPKDDYQSSSPRNANRSDDIDF